MLMFTFQSMELWSSMDVLKFAWWIAKLILKNWKNQKLWYALGSFEIDAD